MTINDMTSTNTEKLPMWSHEESIDTSAAPSRVWQLFADVAGWPRWNAGIARIELHGAFADGGSFSMQPPGEDAFTSTLCDVRVDEGFSDLTALGGTTVRVDHRIEPLPSGGSRVVYRTRIEGPDAADIGPMVTADFGDVLAALKRLAESPAGAIAA